MHKSESAFAILLCFFLFLPAGVKAQQGRITETNPNYQQGDWISYSVNRFITSIAVGRQYAYFGTTGGITRYNFYANEWDYPYTTSSGLADNRISAVAFDEQTGLLWCATQKSISYFHPTARKWYNGFKDHQGIVVNDKIISIGIGENDLIFETAGGRRYLGQKHGGINFMIAPKDDSVQRKWFGARARKRPPYPHYFMNDNYIFQRDGIISDQRLRSGRVTGIVEDKWQKVWMGSWRFGAIIGDVRTEMLEVLPYGLFSPRVDAIAFDENGIWFAGRNGPGKESGITYWDQARDRWAYFETRLIAELPGDQIFKMVVADGKLYCATQFGISVLDFSENEWSRLAPSFPFANEAVYSLAVSGDFLWAGSENGLTKINLATAHTDSAEVLEVNELSGTAVYDIEVTERAVWTASAIGIFLYEEDRNEWGIASGKDAPVAAFTREIARNGDEIWFGGNGVVHAFNMKTHKWYAQPESKRDLPGPVLAIAADAFSVWVGTRSGVFKLNRESRTWRRFDRIDGLIDTRVNEIVIDGDYVWFGTPKGATTFFWNDPHRVD